MVTTPLVIQRSSDSRYLTNFELAPETPDNAPRPLQVAWSAELSEAFPFDSGDPASLMAALSIKRLLTPKHEVHIVAHPDPALYHAAEQRRFNAEIMSAKAIAVDVLTGLTDKFIECNCSKSEGAMVAAIIAASVLSEICADKIKPDRDSIRANFIRSFDAFFEAIAEERAKLRKAG